jgi:F-type H+-transporting ATPase subunit b
MTGMRKLIALAIVAGLAATQSHAASEYGFFSLRNTDFIVLLGFIVFIGVLVYFKVPGMVGGMLDKRAEQIRADLDEARALREEAQKLLASYERKSREVQEQADRIVRQAREESETAAAEARAALEHALARRLKAAEEQIASAEQSAVREVRDRAVQVAIAAAAEALAKGMSAADASARIDASIKEVAAKLH